jgi:HSP20 family protein
MDVTETDDEIAVTAELPGVDEEEEKGRRHDQLERSYGAFRRSIPLPQEVDQDKAEASFKKGGLRVTLPKAVSDKELVKRIQVERN